MKHTSGIFSQRFLLSDMAVIGYLALAKLVLHFLTNGQYGYFRDELYPNLGEDSDLLRRR